MNTPLLIAGILCFFAFFAHAFLGDKEYSHIKPGAYADESMKQAWIQGRSGWHWVSLDLLLSALLLMTLAISNIIQAKQEVCFLISIYYCFTGFAWLITVFFSKNNNKQLLVLGQWFFCFAVSALVYYGGCIYT